ncbi:CDP-diacylglycerol--glycerol-3-phosphate 3-phosphatidyltransferase [candidate division KSB3 bacterium]|uniref:CDP-diacylglycerol--glycerol-3-phosphate 3-phosphatidyltransferase n=1 Tax=candidate division KSB3 bacterium TaxID=2044937 RepID=A0A9D5Q8D5_9BACT|nr:CDP-diacylglycerol--glycerol-3-phosphate 3-phosphatidyltransferase [candidate division KSB3 bacterium]MBD3327358.1 CDP-diacylglycerol--glycerol-3-phosphate 3-phosphatidyltransferase [candidate division KSB3 bacterium]
MHFSEFITRAATHYNDLNIPNVLTILRVVAIPFFIVALAYKHNGIALAIFFGCGVTDGLDGFIARTYHQRTSIGAFLDPLADKLLLTSSFITLFLLDLPNKLPLWLLVTVISRDIIISVGVAALYIVGTPIRIAPSKTGKFTTFLQVFLLIVVLFYNYKGVSRPHLILSLCWLTFAATVISGVGYLYQGIRFLNLDLEESQDDSLPDSHDDT